MSAELAEVVARSCPDRRMRRPQAGLREKHGKYPRNVLRLLSEELLVPRHDAVVQKDHRPDEMGDG